jgi:hypothetical protein
VDPAPTPAARHADALTLAAAYEAWQERQKEAARRERDMERVAKYRNAVASGDGRKKAAAGASPG